MIDALSLTIEDLRLPVVRRTLLQVVVWTIAIFVVIALLIGWGLESLDVGQWVQKSTGGGGLVAWLVQGVGWLIAGLGYLLIMWLSFVIVAQNVAAFYLDRVIGAVEREHHPGLAEAPGSSIVADIAAMLRFTCVLVVLNIVAIPFYFVPGLNLAVFYLLNGYLFGREYAEAVALRRMNSREVRAWRGANRASLWIAGVLITLAMSVPVLNVAAPVVSAVFMTHIFHAKGGVLGASSARRDA